MLFAGYLVLGGLAGLLAGLFGIGGGIIIVPALVISFEIQGVAPSVLTHMAVGTSLATIIFTSVSSIRQHHRAGAVDWPLVRIMAVGLCLGTATGALSADAISGPRLQQLIGVFAIALALRMAFAGPPRPTRTLPPPPGLFGVGVVIGWASAIFGIGGGSLSVPFLTRCNVVMQRAVATSAALGFPIAVSGAIFHMIAGLGKPDLPTWSTGYIYWPAFLGIVLTSMYCARLGAKLAHRLPAPVLRRIFAVLLVLVGMRFLIANL